MNKEIYKRIASLLFAPCPLDWLIGEDFLFYGLFKYLMPCRDSFVQLSGSLNVMSETIKAINETFATRRLNQ